MARYKINVFKGWFDLDSNSSGGSSIERIGTDSGTAIPSGGAVNILGGTATTTRASGDDIYIDVTTVPTANGGTGQNFGSSTGLISLSSGTATATQTPVVNSITISNSPTLPTDGANKAYVDLVAAGFSPKVACVVGTTANLTATYNNGASGVGATLTNSGAQAALVINGVTLALNDRVLVKDQSSTPNNGIYYVSDIGSVSTNWVLTRATDFDTPAEMSAFSLVATLDGTVDANTFWYLTNSVVTVGTTPVVWGSFLQQGILTLTGNSGIASGSNVTISGGNNITTTGSGSTLSVAVTGTTNHAVQVGNSSGSLTSVSPSSTSGVPLISQGSSADPVFGTAVVAGGGTGVTSLSTYQLLAGGTTSTGALQQIAIGSSGQVLQSAGAGALASYSTATYPSTATSSGTILRANGTNWLASTSTFADTYAVSTLLYASSANTVSGLATANNATLTTNGSGVPSWITTSSGYVTSITGTANQVIASASTGAVTLSLPQSIATTSTPTFGALTLSGTSTNELAINYDGGVSNSNLQNIWTSYTGTFTNPAFGNVLQFSQARGSLASPTATVSGDNLMFLGAGGYQGTTPAFTSIRAGIGAFAVENFTSTAQGTKLSFLVTNATTTSRITAMDIAASGVLNPFFGIQNINGSNSAPSYSFSGSTGTGMYSTGTNNLSLATNSTQRVSIDSSGNVTFSIKAISPAFQMSTGAVSGYIIQGDASGNFSWVAPGSAVVTTVTGTANQVLANGTSGTPQGGAVTVTTPQDIGTSSSVTFGQLNVDNLRLDGNTISSTNTSGDINIYPDSGGTLRCNSVFLLTNSQLIRNDSNNAFSESFSFQKSTNNGNTANGCELGYLNFAGYANSNYQNAARIIVNQQGSSSGSNIPAQMSISISDTSGLRSVLNINSAGDLSVQTGDLYISNDNKSLILGTGNDAKFYYDGTNAVIDPKAVGSGYLSVLGEVYCEGETVTNTTRAYGLLVSGTCSVSSGSEQCGIRVSPTLTGSSLQNVTGIYSIPTFSNTGGFNVIGASFFADFTLAGNSNQLGTAYGFYAYCQGGTTGKVFNAYGLGVIAPVSGGTNSCAIFSGGNTGFKKPAPTHTLELGDDDAAKTTTTTWTTTSDARIKRDIEDVNEGLSVINALRPVKYKHTEEFIQHLDIAEKSIYKKEAHYYRMRSKKRNGCPNTTYYGFVADEVEQVMPSCVTTSSECVGQHQGIKKFNMHNILIMMVKSIQELSKEVDDLKSQLAAKDVQ